MKLPAATERVAFDVLVGLLLATALLEALLSEDVEGFTPGIVALTLVWGGVLLLRERLPILAPVIVLLGVDVEAAVWPHSISYTFSAFLTVMLAVGLLGAHVRGTWPRVAAAGLVLGSVALVVGRDPEGDWADLVTTSAIALVAWMIGHSWRASSERNAELRARADRLERERETEARAAAAEERARIAREMHDVVAHSLSVMVVQAEAAEAMLDADPERARRPLAAVQDTGRSALTELRRMLGVLREMADEGPALAPQPGLDGLEALVGHVRDAGLPVTLRVEGEPHPLPPGIDLSAYRIVQEALTNTLKHAGPARADVLVRYGPRELELQVIDDGRGHDPAGNGGGHGLVGMRERVALYGGRLAAGPRPAPEGGFALTAALPIDAEPGS